VGEGEPGHLLGSNGSVAACNIMSRTAKFLNVLEKYLSPLPEYSFGRRSSPPLKTLWYSNVLVELFQVEKPAYLSKSANLFTTSVSNLN